MNNSQNKRSPEEITSFLAQWQQSGQSKKQFCIEKEINYQTFIGWCVQRKQKAIKENRKFIPVELSQKQDGIFAEIHLSSAKKIILHQAVPSEFIQAILKC